MQIDLICYNSSTPTSRQPSLQRAVTPGTAPAHPAGPTPQTSSTSNSRNSRAPSPRASDSTASGAQSSSSAHASSSDHGDDASSLTTRSSGSQHGMQVPSMKAPKGPVSSRVAGVGGDMGSRKGSMRAQGRKTSEELPDVTGRQSDHTIFDVTGVRRINTARKRVFGSSV